ncbi:metal-dependent hydrolase [alpha proteobacterium U9-1i]|nr:metal-dependent hydrolase [alpha proteobacterium U9-1i]
MRWALALVLFVAACATAPAPAPTQSAQLRIASWNMEHLAEANGSGCRPRTDANYVAMRNFANQIDADVVAFQEVESVAAAQRVFDPAHYDIVIEARAGSGGRLECRSLPGQYLNRQATGFAIRRGLAFDRKPDFTELQGGDADLRSAVDVSVRISEGQRVRLLSVHLKSGCASGVGNDACPQFLAQVPVLESWIDARVRAGEEFIVLGDFNRRLAEPSDAVWADWNDGDPTGASLVLGAGAVTPRCDPRYRSFIDHLIVPVAEVSHVSNFREWTFGSDPLSDHCPVSIEWRG